MSRSLTAEITLYIQDTFLSTAVVVFSHLFVLYITQSVSESTHLTPKDKSIVILDPGALEIQHLLKEGLQSKKNPTASN